jgi:hypothetical protein
VDDDRTARVQRCPLGGRVAQQATDAVVGAVRRAGKTGKELPDLEETRLGRYESGAVRHGVGGVVALQSRLEEFLLRPELLVHAVAIDAQMRRQLLGRGVVEPLAPKQGNRLIQDVVRVVTFLSAHTDLQLTRELFLIIYN